MRIAFLGGILSPKLKISLEAKNKISIQYAADIFQKALIHGFTLNKETISIFSLPFLPSWLFNNSIRKIKRETYTLDLHSVYIGGYYNFPIFNLMTKSISAFNLLSKSKEKHEFVLVYSMHTPLLLASYLYKKLINKKVCICLIVPDLPEFMSESENLVYLALKKIDSCLIRFLLRSVDKYILISPFMKERLPISNKDTLVIEGIFCDDSTLNINDISKTSKFVFLYSGTLDIRYNILDLLNAFCLLKNKDVELWICGKGNAEVEIAKRVKIDNRIKYFGQVPHEKILVLQKQATVLVNPRKAEGIFTRYSFPSKTIEYMASGTPTLMYQLPSIPKEYFPHLLFINTSEHTFKERLEQVINMKRDELIGMGRVAKEFIINNKTSKIQVRKILNFIKS